MNKRAIILRTHCEEAVERFQPADLDGDPTTIETQCNFALNWLAIKMGHKGFPGGSKYKPVLTANEIAKQLKTDPDFVKLERTDISDVGYIAKREADQGKLVIAARAADPHGHVAVVLPGGELVRSRKWGGELCPQLANVGRNNGLVGANWAFGSKPEYYLWLGA